MDMTYVHGDRTHHRWKCVEAKAASHTAAADKPISGHRYSCEDPFHCLSLIHKNQSPLPSANDCLSLEETNMLEMQVPENPLKLRE
eukprot:scaffold28937_cov19-Prasinocladus_malaysianus.AAC.1